MKKLVSYLAAGCAAALVLSGCFAGLTERQQVCVDLEAVATEHGGVMSGSSVADPAEVAVLGAAVADATGESVEFVGLRVAARSLTITAVDPSSASQVGITMHQQALESFANEMNKAVALCEAA